MKQEHIKLSYLRTRPQGILQDSVATTPSAQNTEVDGQPKRALGRREVEWTGKKLDGSPSYKSVKTYFLFYYTIYLSVNKQIHRCL
jgi:hypothetical protein